MMAGGLPDILAPGLAVVFCGLNPGLSSAASGHHFAGRSNRFWKVLHLAGFTPTQIEPEDDARVLAFGVGLTVVVERPTAGADELANEEFRARDLALRRKIERYAPRTIAFLGKAAFSAIARQREVAWGRQTTTIAGATVWVMPNPSGRNLAFSLEALVEAYGRLRQDVGSVAGPQA